MLGIFEKCVTHLQTQTHFPVNPSPHWTPLIALEDVNLCAYLCRGLPALL